MTGAYMRHARLAQSLAPAEAEQSEAARGIEASEAAWGTRVRLTHFWRLGHLTQCAGTEMWAAMKPRPLKAKYLRRLA
jgi:hypothetical protein